MNKHEQKKQMLRRTLAFVSALSFTYFSSLTEINSVITAEDSNPSTGSIAIDPSDSEAADSSNPETTPVTTYTTDENNPDNRIPVEEIHETEVTLNFHFSGNVSSENAKKAIDELTRNYPKSSHSADNESLYSRKLVFNNEMPSFDNISDNCTHYKVGSKTYVVFQNADRRNNIDQMYSISVNGTEINMELCYIFTPESSMKYDSNENCFCTDFLNVKGQIIKHNNSYYIDRNEILSVEGKKGWYTNNGNKISAVDIPSLSNLVNKDVYITSKTENNTVTFTSHYQNQQSDLTKIEFSEAEVNFSINDNTNKNVSIVDYSYGSRLIHNNAKIVWSIAEKMNLGFQSNSKIEYDVTVEWAGNSKKYENCTDGFNFSEKFSAELADALYQKNVTVSIDIRPDKNEYKLNLENADSDNYPDNIEISISKNKLLIPNLYTTGNETFYLHSIETKSGKIDDILLDDIISESSERYSELNFNEYFDKIAVINYKKIPDKKTDNSEFEILGKLRNSKCRTIKSEKNEATLISFKGEKCIICYEIKGQYRITEYSDSFTVIADDNCNTVRIFNIFNTTNPSAPVNIPIPNEYDRLFYIDHDDPVISSLSLTKDGKTAYEQDSNIWFNGSCILSATVTDRWNSNSNENELINEPSLNCAEIDSISVGRQSSNDVLIPYNAFTFKKDESNTWGLYGNHENSVLPYSISDIDVQQMENGEIKIDLTVEPKDGEKLINEKIYVTVTDLAGRKAVKGIDFNIDRTAPNISEFSIENLLPSEGSKSGKKCTPADKLLASVTASDNAAYNFYSATAAETEDENGNKKYNAQINSKDIIHKGSGIADITVKYIYNGKEETFINSSPIDIVSSDGEQRKISSALDISDKIKNTSGIIEITVTDNAGNTRTGYYDSDDSTGFSAMYTTIILDNQAPECGFSNIPERTQHNEENDENWFADYPKGLKLIIFDSPAASSEFENSKISKLNLSVNGFTESINLNSIYIYSSVSLEEFLSNLKSGKYELRIKTNPNDEDQIEVYLENPSDPNNSIRLAYFDKPEDGKYKITVSAEDFAGNKSNETEYSFSIDDSKPLVDPVYKIVDSNDGIRKFGSFFNKNIILEATVTESGSGLNTKSAKLYYGDKSDEYYECQDSSKSSDEEDTYTLKFLLPEDFKDAFVTQEYKLNLKLTVSDNVGNKNSEDSDYMVSEENSDLLIFETEAPSIIVGEDEDIQEKYDGKWFSDDVTIPFSITDKKSDIYSGIAAITASVVHQNVDNTTTEIKNSTNDTNKKILFTEEKEITDSYIIELSTDESNLDGEFIFTVDSADNAGNEYKGTKEIHIFKDITAPEITSFKFSNPKKDEDKAGIFDKLRPYLHFGNSTEVQTVTVYAEDKNASSGIAEIALELYDNTDGQPLAVPKGELRYDENTKTYSMEFELPQNFKGTMRAKAIDNVGNTPEDWMSPDGYVHETPDKHKTETTPYEIVLPDTEYRDLKGNKLYNHDIDAKITVKDTVSGIRDITVSYPDGKKELHTGLSSEELPSDWKLEKNDINLPTEISTVIGQTSNKNYNEISVTGSDYSDNSINSSEPVVFSIDKTKPNITVSFDNDNADSSYQTFYKSARTATIRIKERNFSPDKVKTSIPVSGQWTLISGQDTEGTDNAVYQNTVTLGTDGTYKLTVDCTDLCDNPAENPYDSGDFTIDLSSPEVKVSFDNNSSLNTNYFNGNRTATIEVDDLNFAAERVSITGTKNGKAEDFPVKSGLVNGKSLSWSHGSGNKWTASVPVDTDGFYEFNVTASDKSGNSSVPYHTEFHIDTLPAEITFNGVENQHAYNGEVKPVIVIDDKNIDYDTVVISMKGSKNGTSVKLEGTAEKENGKYIFTANDIPHTPENDDIYTITAEAEDLAGNPSSSEIKISVNRFGSTFEPDEQSAFLNGNTVMESGDVVINEINTDKHPDDFKPTVKVTKNGSNTVLTEGEHYTVKLDTDSGTGWYKYVYTIDSDVFADDGVYEITIYSEDNATNKNYGNSIMKFSIDKTKPTVNYLTIEQGGIYKAEQKQVIAVLNDNMEIDTESISVLINDQPISSNDFSYDSKLNEISFSMSNSNATQFVEIKASDIAGNELDPDQSKIDNLFISTSSARILLHKTWFKVTAAVVAVAAAASGTVLFLKKKKRNR